MKGMKIVSQKGRVERKDEIAPGLEEHRRCVVESNLEKLKEVVKKTGLVGNEKLFGIAVVSGNIEIVKYLVDKGCPRRKDSKYLYTALRSDNMEMLRYFSSFMTKWSSTTKNYACSKGNVEVLRLMESSGVYFNAFMKSRICSKGDVQCVKFLLDMEHIFSGGDFTSLCESDNLESVKTVHRSGKYELDDDEEDPYRFTSSIEIVKYLHEVMKVETHPITLDTQISNDRIEIVKYLVGMGLKPDEDSAFQALDSCNLEMMKYLHELGCPFPIDENIFFSYYPDKSVRTAHKYYHDNIFDKSLCHVECKFCLEMKNEILWDSWELINEDFQSYNQWFPREMMEDVVALTTVFYKPPKKLKLIVRK